MFTLANDSSTSLRVLTGQVHLRQLHVNFLSVAHLGARTCSVSPEVLFNTTYSTTCRVTHYTVAYAEDGLGAQTPLPIAHTETIFRVTDCGIGLDSFKTTPFAFQL